LVEKPDEKPNDPPSNTPPYVPPSDTPFGEDLQVIIELELNSLSELFGAALDAQTEQKIREAINYSQVVQARQEFLARHLGSQSGSNVVPAKSKLPWSERII
jgi:hypothetical protein